MHDLIRRFARGLVLGAVVISGAGIAAAQDQTFVCFDGSFDGDSTDPDHTNWIDAYGLDHGVAASPTGGAATFTDVAFLKGTDKATVKLHEFLAKGLISPKVVIDVCRPGAGPGLNCYYTVVLENVKITAVDLAGSACVDPASSCTPPQTESVSLSFEKISWRNRDAAGQNIHFECWDLQQNSLCASTPSTSCG